MSLRFIVSSEIDMLGEALYAELKQRAKKQDPLIPITIVLPNSNLKRYLQILLTRLSEKSGGAGIVANVKFLYLEDFLNKGLRSVLPNDKEYIVIKKREIQFLVMAMYFRNSLPPAAQMLFQSNEPISVVQTAGKIADLLTSYELQRRNLLKEWIKDSQYNLVDTAGDAQRDLFVELKGWCDKRNLNASSVKEINYFFLERTLTLLTSNRPDIAEDVYFFGLSLVSPTHVETLYKLSKHSHFHFFQFSWLKELSLLEKSKKKVSPNVFLGTERKSVFAWGNPSVDFFRLWNKFSKTSLDTLPRVNPLPKSLLGKTQEFLLGIESSESVQPDETLQIVACPGRKREVETVYNSILYELQREPGLKLSDIVILSPDINVYLPYFQAIFERDVLPNGNVRVPYNLSDFIAADASLMYKGLDLFFDIVEYGLDRKGLFALLSNPCFQWKFSLSDREVTDWIETIDELNIFRKYDTEDGDYGKPFTFRSGLRKLLLSSVFDLDPGESWMNITPYKAIRDDDSLSKFCLAIESVHEEMLTLKSRGPGESLTHDFVRILDRFFEIPHYAPEEAEIYSRIVRTIGEIESLEEEYEVTLDLPTFRYFLRSALLEGSGSRGGYMSQGITISSLRPMRPIPFRLVYVVGLGEGDFPTPESKSSLDMRNPGEIGDLTRPMSDRFLFLEHVLSAKEKLFLTYPSHDLVKDCELFPGSALTEFKGVIEENVIKGPLPIESVPLRLSSKVYLNRSITERRPGVFANYSRLDLEIAKYRNQIIAKDDVRVFETQHNKFSISALGDTSKELMRISTRELAWFMCRPMHGAIRRKGIYDRKGRDVLGDLDEPIFPQIDFGMQDAIMRSIIDSVQKNEGFDLASFVETWRLAGYTPDSPFDSRLEEELSKRYSRSIEPIRHFIKEHGHLSTYDIYRNDQEQEQEPMLIELSTGQKIEIFGSLPYAFQDSGLGCLIMRPKSKNYSKDLVMAWTFYLLWCATDVTIKSNRFSAYSFTSPTFEGIDLEAQFQMEPEKAKEYLKALCEDFFSAKLRRIGQDAFNAWRDARGDRKRFDLSYPEVIDSYDEFVHLFDLGMSEEDRKRLLEMWEPLDRCIV